MHEMGIALEIIDIATASIVSSCSNATRLLSTAFSSRRPATSSGVDTGSAST
jgi:hypothetical protein